MKNIAKLLFRKKAKVQAKLLDQVLIERYSSTPATVVQVGVCDGKINDPIYELIKNVIQTKTIVLIEPQAELLNIISQNYSFHNDTHIVNCAIGPQGQIKLYRLAEKFHDHLARDYLHDAPSYRVPAGFVSINREHVIDHIRGKMFDDVILDDAIEELSVDCRDLSSVLEAINVDSFDVLQVDCEGMDDVVLYNCNLDQFKPSIIHFEHMHLSDDRKKQVVKYLENLGYRVSKYSNSDMLAVI